VTNSAGAVTSSVATLAVNVPPSITNQPQSQTVFVGASPTFSAGASGTAPLGYQWRFNGTNISGATNSGYTRNNAQLADAGNYSAVVSNVAGTATSSNATLTVVPVNVAPAITAQPQSQTTNQGSDVTFAVTATGTPPPTYQWRFNGTNIPGATATAYTRANVQPADAGDYSVVASNVAGSATSSNATLTVNVPPAITAQPQGLTATAGSNVTFSVTATGTAPLSYLWRFNGANISGASDSAYTRNNVQSADAGDYSVLVSNVAGSATGSNATLTVVQPIELHMDSLTILPDGRILLQISGPPDHYAIDGTADLVDWVELTNFTTTNTTFEYIDSETDLPLRFYRVHPVP
jgi:hypothetical protein